MHCWLTDLPAIPCGGIYFRISAEQKTFLQEEHGTYCTGSREQKITGLFSQGALISRLGYLLGFRVILCPDPFKLIQVVWS